MGGWGGLGRGRKGGLNALLYVASGWVDGWEGGEEGRVVGHCPHEELLVGGIEWERLA